jgi:hypothetical protein
LQLTLTVNPKESTHEDGLLRRARGEYRDTPGLRLTTQQASRLMGLELDVCESVLQRLVDARVLRRTRDGAFVCDD